MVETGKSSWGLVRGAKYGTSGMSERMEGAAAARLNLWSVWVSRTLSESPSWGTLIKTVPSCRVWWLGLVLRASRTPEGRRT